MLLLTGRNTVDKKRGDRKSTIIFQSSTSVQGSNRYCRVPISRPLIFEIEIVWLPTKFKLAARVIWVKSTLTDVLILDRYKIDTGSCWHFEQFTSICPHWIGTALNKKWHPTSCIHSSLKRSFWYDFYSKAECGSFLFFSLWSNSTILFSAFDAGFYSWVEGTYLSKYYQNIMRGHQHWIPRIILMRSIEYTQEHFLNCLFHYKYNYCQKFIQSYNSK